MFKIPSVKTFDSDISTISNTSFKPDFINVQIPVTDMLWKCAYLIA